MEQISLPPPQLTGAIYVVDELDYETKQSYDLIVRATDSVSGVSAEVPVSIVVTDINDSPPTLPRDNYDITVSESLPFGSSILKVTAQDDDIGKAKISPCILMIMLAPWQQLRSLIISSMYILRDG